MSYNNGMVYLHHDGRGVIDNNYSNTLQLCNEFLKSCELMCSGDVCGNNHCDVFVLERLWIHWMNGTLGKKTGSEWCMSVRQWGTVFEGIENCRPSLSDAELCER
jgi:hypothetical protein